MWLTYAFLSALFAGVTSILAKIGIKNTDSGVATALRTVVVVIFAWIMVFVAGSESTLKSISSKNLLFLALSGFATGASWLCYFRALQIGDVSKVVPVDKSSAVLSMLLAFLIFGEPLGAAELIAMVLIAAGTYMMIERKMGRSSASKGGGWFFYAFLSAVFAALTSILGKIGIENVESNAGVAIRTLVVLLMAWLVVFVQKKQKQIKSIKARSWVFLILSGFATGASWLCYYRALQTGPASVVVPIDKLSILVTVGFGYFVLKEKLSKTALWGLVILTFGTLLLLV